MSGISVVIITKNEQSNIRACLEDLRWADEIIIVDDRSDDSTIEICKQYANVKVYHRNMTDGFGPQKNYALERASNDWVLVLDADERVSHELKQEIQSKIQDTRYDGFYVRRVNMVLGKKCLDYKTAALRLFKKSKGKFTTKMVHESVVLNGKIGKLRNLLFHYPSSMASVKEYVNIYLDKYTTYSVQDLYKMGRRVTIRTWFLYFILKPTFVFLQKLFLKREFINGVQGYLASAFSALAYFINYCKLWERQKKNF